MHTKPYSKKGAGKRANLVRARLARKMSQDDVAKELGCSRELYSQIENGTRDGRTMSMASKLSAFFKKPQEFLMEEFESVEIFKEDQNNG